MNNKDVCIIIVNFNGKEYLQDCLNSIRKNTRYEPYKVIVVDNNSEDGSISFLKKKYKWVDLIENKNNEGFSGGNNIGIKYCLKKYSPKYFYLLNNDTKVNEDWLSSSVKRIEDDDENGIVGSKQISFEGEESLSYGDINLFGVKYYRGERVRTVNWVSGACLLIKTEALKEAGLFDEIYNPAYYEETDLELRVRNKGYKILANPHSVVYHKGGATTSKELTRYSELFYRNRLIFFVKNFGWMYFLPRIAVDLYRGIKNNQLGVVLSGYRSGKRRLKKYKSKMKN